MPWGMIVAFAVAAILSVIGLRYDRRTRREKEDADRAKLGYAVGVPGLFDRRP